MVDPVGPLATMWRSVYRKASEAAAVTMAALLRDHVYLFHRTLPAAGGGGLVELGRAVATAGQVTLRAPASGALPTGYSGLWVAAQGRNNAASGNRNVYLFFNDDTTVGPYNYGSVNGTPTTGAVTAGGSAIDSAISLGLAPAQNAGEPQTVFGLAGTVPQHESAAFPKVGHFTSTYLLTAAAGPLPRTTLAVYTPAAPGGITSVSLRCLTDGWRVGSTLLVYGVPNAA